MSRARCAAAAALCAAAAVTGCGSRSSITLPVVTGGFGTDPLDSLPTQGPPGGSWSARGNASVNVTGTGTLVFVFDILAAARG